MQRHQRMEESVVCVASDGSRAEADEQPHHDPHFAPRSGSTLRRETDADRFPTMDRRSHRQGRSLSEHRGASVAGPKPVCRCFTGTTFVDEKDLNASVAQFAAVQATTHQSESRVKGPTKSEGN